MANITITNNGDATLGDPSIIFVDADGIETVIPPGASSGVAMPPSLKIVAE